MISEVISEVIYAGPKQVLNSLSKVIRFHFSLLYYAM